MSMTNPDSIPTKELLHEMYERMYPYLGGGGSGGSGGHTIEDSTGNPLTQRDTMQFSGSFAPTDDSTNEVTKIELNKLDSGEIDDIVTPLPSVQARYHKYSTDEHIVGEWIDGSYIYEKTYSLRVTSSGTITIEQLPLNLDVMNTFGFLKLDSGFTNFVNCYYTNDYFCFIECRNNNKLNLIVEGWYPATAYLTIQYTKSSS